MSRHAQDSNVWFFVVFRVGVDPTLHWHDHVVQN